MIEVTSSLDHRWLRASLFVAAAVALGHALQIQNGTYEPYALVWLTVSIVCCLAGTLLPPVPINARLGGWIVVIVLTAGLAWQFAALFVDPPGVFLKRAPGWDTVFYPSLAAAALVTSSFLVSARAALVRVAIIVGLFVVLGSWVIQTSPAPPIDVFVFQDRGSSALAHGRNPYAATYPNIYDEPGPYGPGLSVNHLLTFGVPYPPLSVVMAMPGYLFFRDVRYAHLAAMALAAVLMAAAVPGRISALAAALFLFTPRSLFVLEQSWTEPFVIFLTSVVVWLACRQSRFLPHALGLAVAVKQYMVLALPAAWALIRPGPDARVRFRDLTWRAAATAFAVTLPLAIWDVGAFMRSVVTLQFHQPFRMDALSYLVLLAHGPSGPPSSLWTALAGAIGLAIGIWRSPRTPAGFAATLALGSVSVFAFSKQGFCNYYYFTIGMLCLAVAAMYARGLMPNSARNA